MRVQSFISSAVIGLAAVSVAMPMIQERAIVTLGGGDKTNNNNNNNNDQPGQSDVSPTTITTTASAESATPTINNGQWSPTKQMNAKPDDGMYNATKYDNSNEFDNGLYHPTATSVSISPTATTIIVSGNSDSDSGSNSTKGTQVSSGISFRLPDHDPNDHNDNKQHGCFFNIFCF